MCLWEEDGPWVKKELVCSEEVAVVSRVLTHPSQTSIHGASLKSRSVLGSKEAEDGRFKTESVADVDQRSQIHTTRAQGSLNDIYGLQTDQEHPQPDDPEFEGRSTNNFRCLRLKTAAEQLSSTAPLEELPIHPAPKTSTLSSFYPREGITKEDRLSRQSRTDDNRFYLSPTNNSLKQSGTGKFSSPGDFYIKENIARSNNKVPSLQKSPVLRSGDLSSCYFASPGSLIKQFSSTLGTNTKMDRRRATKEPLPSSIQNFLIERKFRRKFKPDVPQFEFASPNSKSRDWPGSYTRPARTDVFTFDHLITSLTVHKPR
jgi:hypothetical protein